MALDPLLGPADLFNLMPKSNEIRHVYLTIKGDAAYPGGNGSTNALAFLRDLMKTQSSQYKDADAGGNPGVWIDAAVIRSFQTVREDPSLVRILLFDKANDTLQVRLAADDSIVGGGDLSADTYVVKLELT